MVSTKNSTVSKLSIQQYTVQKAWFFLLPSSHITTNRYVADFQIKDFTFSWNSGLALCGLIHKHRPDLLDYWGLDKNAKKENTALAMDIAAKHLNIPKLFEAEGIK